MCSSFVGLQAVPVDHTRAAFGSRLGIYWVHTGHVCWLDAQRSYRSKRSNAHKT